MWIGAHHTLAIKQNEAIIKRKQGLNRAIEEEYKLSSQKETEIKQAFEKLKEKVKVQEPQQLLERFAQLYQKVPPQPNPWANPRLEHSHG